MKPPKNVKVMEWSTSTLWFDELGILCAISKKVPPQTLDEVKKEMEDFKKLVGNKKVCLLIDVTHSNESNKEARDYAAIEFPKFIKAIAMLSDSALGRMLANMFFRIKSQPYPVKMFNTEEEAKNWLKQYL